MALNFPNVSILGYTQNSRTFDAGLQYSNLVKINIEGLIIDLTQDFGISGVWTGIEGILPTISKNNNYQDLFLNGKSFGTGRIESINFRPGNDVRTKTYTAQLIVYDSGNLFNLGGTYYNTIDSTNFQYLENFSEDYNFERKINGGYSYNHNSNIRFNSGVGNLNSINTAKTLAKTLFTGANLGFLFYSGYTNKIGKRFYNESYNLINNECNFSETFNFDEDSGNYSAIRTNSFELAENGNIIVTENGTINGIEFPTYKAALGALSYEISNGYTRCNQLFNIYSPPNSQPLINSPTVQSRTLDIFNNNVAYTLVFENNPRNSGGYFWDYTQNIDRSEGIARITENGTILGRGENRADAFVNAIGGLNTIRPGIAGRISAIFLSQIGSNYNNIETKEEAFSPYKSVCNYTYQFSNEQIIIGTNGVKRIKVVQNDNLPLYSYNKINIINFGEIAQDNVQVSLAERNMSLQLDGEKIVPLLSYLDNAKTVLNTFVPGGQNPIIISAQYSFDPNNNNTSINLAWNYTNIKSLGDINL